MKYELTQHAHESLTERDISTLWLERVLQSPERTELDKQDAGLTHHLVWFTPAIW